MGQLIDDYQRSGLDIDLQELFESFLTIVREQGLRVPSDYVVLLTTLAMLQGVAKHMAPDFRLTDTVAAYARSAVGDRLSPEQLMTGAHRTMARYKHLLDDLPVGLSRTLRRASEGEFRVAVRPSDYDRLLDRLRDLVMPLCFTVILAALIVGSSIIVALRPGNTTADVVGGAMLAVTTAVAVFWMITLLLSRRRHRG